MPGSMLDDYDRAGRKDRPCCEIGQNILIKLRSVRRIEEHDVELRRGFCKLFERSDHVAADESESTLDVKRVEVCFDDRAGGARALNKNHVACASAERFDPDRP